MTRIAAVLGAAFCLGYACMGWAQTPEEEAAAIRKRAEEYVAAYNQADAGAIAELWSEAGVYVNRDTGERIEGRSAIAAMFQSLFANGDTSQLSVTVDTIRLITPEVAVEDGTAKLASEGAAPLESTYTAVHVKKDGAWYLDSVRETDTPAPPTPAADTNGLDDIAWLVGSWVDEDEAATVTTTTSWAKNNKFLTSAFSVHAGEDVDLQGTQIIGWDPAAGQIRSWVFDSDGGFGEGRWRREGNQWIVDATFTLSDGSQGSSVNTYTYLDENTFTFKSVDRQINGEEQPDLEEVPVRRQ